MIHGSRHPDITVRASLWAGSKVRRRTPAALLLSGLILISAVAPAAAEQSFCNKQYTNHLSSVIQCFQAEAKAKEAANEAAKRAKQDPVENEKRELQFFKHQGHRSDD